MAQISHNDCKSNLQRRSSRKVFERRYWIIYTTNQYQKNWFQHFRFFFDKGAHSRLNDIKNGKTALQAVTGELVRQSEPQLMHIERWNSIVIRFNTGFVLVRLVDIEENVSSGIFWRTENPLCDQKIPGLTDETFVYIIFHHFSCICSKLDHVLTQLLVRDVFDHGLHFYAPPVSWHWKLGSRPLLSSLDTFSWLAVVTYSIIFFRFDCNNKEEAIDNRMVHALVK